MTQQARRGASNDSVLKVKCPFCSANALFSEKNPFRPFCSEACRNRDLAAWASDQYQVPGPQLDPEMLHESSGRNDDREDESNF